MSANQQIKYTKEEVIEYHSNNYPGNGKLETVPKTRVENMKDLTLAYSPGVAEVCLEIKNDSSLINKYTNIGNTIAVISNGTRVLGLGNIGMAGYPVMEGKSILFKALANVDSFPFILNTEDADEFIKCAKIMAQNFAGINLEDIKKPDCFIIEKNLDEMLPIPVMHDDQWGTAIAALAGSINAMKVVDKKFKDIKVVVNGAGASGLAISKMLFRQGVQGKNMKVIDRNGVIFDGRALGMDDYKRDVANLLNIEKKTQTFSEAVEGADLLVGVSQEGAFKPEHIKKMADDPVVFALCNPDPEILPSIAIKAGAKIVGTGRSDFNNQVNNVLGFPAIFRGALDVKSKKVTKNMKIAAARAIASIIPEDELSVNNILPLPTHPALMPIQATEVGLAAIKEGVAQITPSREELIRVVTEKIEFQQRISVANKKIRDEMIGRDY